MPKFDNCYFGMKSFDALSTPGFVAKVTKHVISDSWRTTSSWVTLHCTNYPKPRDEYWTGSGLWQILLILDWIRTVKRFTKFVFLIQDWIWIAKLDSPLISAKTMEIVTSWEHCGSHKRYA